jgi:SAM-dependent methyltransferase
VSDARATRQSYDCVAQDYANRLRDELRGKPLDRSLLSVFAGMIDGGVAADIGCGPGHVAAQLAVAGVPMIGLDLSPGMCAVGARETRLPFVAGDVAELPLRSASLAGMVCLYTVIHLAEPGRRRAYAEFARVLRPRAPALIAFHTGDADTSAGQVRPTAEFFGHRVELTFHFLDADAEVDALRAAGFELQARLDRAPYEGVEHPSTRSYLLMRRSRAAG